MASAGNRKMRRSRDLVASNDDSLSGFDLYSLQGDASAALDVIAGEAESSQQNNPRSFANRYNTLILSSLVDSSSSVTRYDSNRLLAELSRMNDAYTQTSEDSVSPRKRLRNELIMAFNRALVVFSEGMYTESARICVESLRELMESSANPPDEIAVVSSRMAFLLLECELARSFGEVDGSSRSATTVARVIEWLDRFDCEKDHQFKFLLHLYRSRVDLAVLDRSGKHEDARIRSARKELKQAMDVFQHKLRPTFGAESTESVVSSANSEENTYNSASVTYELQQAPSSVVLQRHNQSALILKANSEQLKGNTKKSLVLCGEAYTAVTKPEVDATYESLHDNNLGIIYETIGKRHLAMHALAKALLYDKSPSSFYADGTVRPDQKLMILHNAAICSLRAHNFMSAYECMATCIARSDIFRSRPQCWLRLAEACVGIFAELKHPQPKAPLFSAVQVRGEPKGIIVNNSLFASHPKLPHEDPVALLASPEDMKQVKRNPLVRARHALEHVIHSDPALGHHALTSARLTLAYVHLAFEKYEGALAMSKLVLKSPDPPSDADAVTRQCHKRQIATARMYAAESSCVLGKTIDAMKFLVGDGQDDAFDRLASDLGGVTIETAATNGKGKRRLARAQTAVRSSASAVTADLGKFTAAKQLAMSAQAMEDAYQSNREQSMSRRALAYTLLKSGNNGAALSLLRSLR